MLELDVGTAPKRRASFRAAAAAPLPVAGEQPSRQLAVPAPRERHEALGVPGEQLVGEARHALRPRQVRGAGQTAEARVAGLVPREEHEVRSQLPRADAAQVLPAWIAMTGRAEPLERRACRLPCPGRWLGGRRRLPAPPTTPRDDDPVGIGDGRVEELHLHPHDRAQPGLASGGREADRAVQALVVGHREAGQAELDRPLDEVIRRRRTVEEREVGVAVELGERHRAQQDRTSVLSHATMGVATGASTHHPLVRPVTTRPHGRHVDVV